MRPIAIFAGLGLALALACTAGGTIIYVDDDANTAGDGKSWATAYRYLQDAPVQAMALVPVPGPVDVNSGEGGTVRRGSAWRSWWLGWLWWR